MLLVSAILAVATTQPLPIAPQPRATHGWVLQHTFTHKAPVTAVTAIAGGYITGDKNGVLMLWNAKTGKLREALLDGTNENAKTINAVRLTPDGKWLNVVADGFLGQIQMTGKDRTYSRPDPWSVFALGDEGYGFTTATQQPFFGNSGTLCVIVQIYRENGYVYTALPYRLQHPAEVRLAAHVPRFIASADATHTIRGWKVNKDEEVEVVQTSVWSVDLKKLIPSALAVSPDGTLVAVAGTTGTIEILNARRGGSVATLKGHRGAVQSVAFTPDSGLLATGGADGTVRLWNPWSGEQEGQLKGHTGPIATAWFASDDVLLTASDDKTARVWVYKP